MAKRKEQAPLRGPAPTITPSEAFKCEDCEVVAEECIEEPLYECGECGNFSGERRCEDCNKFAARAADRYCSECEEAAVTPIWAIYCEACDSWSEVA